MRLKRAFAGILLLSIVSSLAIIALPRKAEQLHSFWNHLEELSFRQILESIAEPSLERDYEGLDIPVASHATTITKKLSAVTEVRFEKGQGNRSKMAGSDGLLEHLHPKLLNGEFSAEDQLEVARALAGRRAEGHRLAVIVPFRAWTNCSRIDPEGVERKQNLAELCNYLSGFLRIQEVDFTIVVIEQERESRMLFNRGALFNVGVDLVHKHFDYLALHDADQIPLSEHNTYDFPELPVHLCTNSTQYRSKARTPEMLGGAVAIQTKHFAEVNGYSNMFWSVGLEDESFFKRIEVKFGRPERLGADAGRYHALSHRKSKILRASRLYKYSERVLREQISGTRQAQDDGLSTVRYTVQNAHVTSRDVLRIKVSLDFPFSPKSFRVTPSTIPK